jgi:uncharacterized protein
MNRPIVLTGGNETIHSFENDCACNSAEIILISSETDNRVNDDCACVTPVFELNSEISRKKKENSKAVYQLESNLHLDSLPRGFTLVISPFSPAGPVALNPAAMARLHQFHRPQPLEQAVDFTLAAANILLPAGREPKIEAAPPAILTAWLHITNACNLDCPYCYVRKSNQKMSMETGRQVIDSIFRSALKNRFQSIKLKYAGGEAALHFGLVRQMHAYAQQLARRHNLDLQAVVLSNGTVWTPDMAGWLTENRVKLMISLDGVGAAHDQLRPTRGGKGSFAAIERIVDTVLLPTGIRPDISITVTGRNAAAAADAVAWAIARNLPFSLNFYRETAASKNFEDLQLEENRIIAGMRQAYHVVEKYLPSRPFINGLLDRVQMTAHQHTCSVGQSYLVFSHTGEVAQCQMHLAQSHPFSDSADPLSIIKNGDIPLIRVEEKEGCRTCPWRFKCSGGCPLETYRATGRFDVKSPHCNIYKTLLPQALRLEGLRLMKVGGVLD